MKFQIPSSLENKHNHDHKHKSSKKLKGPKKETVRNNQTDPLAGIFYTIGCSLMHASMLVTIFFVKRPNPEAARSLDN